MLTTYCTVHQQTKQNHVRFYLNQVLRGHIVFVSHLELGRQTAFRDQLRINVEPRVGV